MLHSTGVLTATVAQCTVQYGAVLYDTVLYCTVHGLRGRHYTVNSALVLALHSVQCTTGNTIQLSYLSISPWSRTGNASSSFLSLSVWFLTMNREWDNPAPTLNTTLLLVLLLLLLLFFFSIIVFLFFFGVICLLLFYFGVTVFVQRCYCFVLRL